MLVPLIHARSIIPKSNKHIWFRQNHILMYVRKSSKKRKYLIVNLLGTCSSDRSLYVFHCRYIGCINRWDVLIIPAFSMLASFFIACPVPCGYLIARVAAIIITTPASLVIMSTWSIMLGWSCSFIVVSILSIRESVRYFHQF
jgi:hypothetical protein